MEQEEENKEPVAFVDNLIHATRMAFQSDVEIILRTNTNIRKNETIITLVSAKAI